MDVPEKKPKRTVAAAAPAAPADDTPLLSLRIYSRCGTSAGTHTAATRDGWGWEWSLRKESRKEQKSSFTCNTFKTKKILNYFYFLTYISSFFTSLSPFPVKLWILATTYLECHSLLFGWVCLFCWEQAGRRGPAREARQLYNAVRRHDDAVRSVSRNQQCCWEC